MDKSRSTKITWTEYTLKSVNKSRSISSDSSSDISTKIENPKKMDIRKDNPILYSRSLHVEIVSSITHNKQLIPRKKKKKKIPDTSIIGRESIQEPDNPSKK